MVLCSRRDGDARLVNQRAIVGFADLFFAGSTNGMFSRAIDHHALADRVWRWGLPRWPIPRDPRRDDARPVTAL